MNRNGKFGCNNGGGGVNNIRSRSWRSSSMKTVFGREQEMKQLDQILLEQERDKEVSSLLGATSTSSSSSSSSSSPVVIIRGPAGSGKSSIVESYPWSSRGYCLAKGKFEAHRIAEPFSAILQALESFVEQWVTLGGEYPPGVTPVIIGDDTLRSTTIPMIGSIPEEEDDDDDHDDEGKRNEGDNIISSKRLEGLQDVLRNDIKVLKNVIPSILRIAGIIEGEEEDTKQELSSSQKPTTTTTTAAVKSPSLRTTTQRKGASFSMDNDTDFCSTSTSTVNAAFRRILTFLCASRPVVFCLDDIQWADAASLDVLQSLVSKGKIPGLLLMVTYREEDVNDDHQLASRLEEFKKNGLVEVHDMHVQDLALDGLNALVAHLLRREESETLALTKVIHEKTNGNPFFVLELMTLLEYEKFLTYSYSTLKWEWGDIDKIQGLTGICNNVAAIVAASIQRLPEETQVALSVAAGLGRKVVPLDVLKEYFNSLAEDDEAASSRSLTSAVVLNEIQGEGVEMVLDGSVSTGILTRTEDPSQESGYSLKWSHDKLLQFAYALIPDRMRASLHMRLGTLLWKMSETTNPSQDWMVFTAADQLNRFYNLRSEDRGGTELLGAAEIAKLNLAAARLSMRKSALFPAMDMLRAGAKHLDGTSDRWSEHYGLCLELYSRLSVIGVHLGQHGDAMKAVEEVEKNAECVDDKFRAHCAMLTSITSGTDRDYDLGVEKTIEILRLYGEKLPRKLRPWQLYFEQKRLKSNLPEDGLEGLLDVPIMKDSRAIKATRLLVQYVNFFAVHSQKYKGIRPLTTIRSLNIACKNGLSEMVASSILGFAIDLKYAGRYKEALKYGEFAVGLVDKFPQRCGSSHCFVRLRAISAVFGAVLPFGTCLEKLLETHRIGLKVGDTEKALSAIVSYSWAYWCVGLPIGPFQSDLISYGREAKTFNLPYPMQVLFKIWEQATANLQIEGMENPTTLIGDVMNQEEVLTKVQGGGKKMTLRDINTMRLMLGCIFNDWDTAQEMVDSLEEYLSNDILISRTYLRTSYLGLASFVLARRTGQKKYKSIGRKVLKYFKREVRKGSVNAFPILSMLEAEESPSKGSYENAIKTCARLGLSHHEAYMSERAGVYFLRMEDDKEWSRIYLDQALSLYKDWGAAGKAHAMRSTLEYSDILTPKNAERVSHNTALKGKRRFTMRDSNLLKAVMGMISHRNLAARS